MPLHESRSYDGLGTDASVSSGHLVVFLFTFHTLCLCSFQHFDGMWATPERSDLVRHECSGVHVAALGKLDPEQPLLVQGCTDPCLDTCWVGRDS